MRISDSGEFLPLFAVVVNRSKSIRAAGVVLIQGLSWRQVPPPR